MGELAVIRLPEPLRILAETRGYLRKGVLLIKPVASSCARALTICPRSMARQSG
jgi:type IV secretory pathway protease TraF